MNFDPKNINTLGVYLGDRRIGVINRLAGDRHIFSFEQDYIDDPNRPTLSLSFKGQTGDLVTSIRTVSKRLPPFFSNLLPEGHLRTYLAKHAGVNEEREFLLLAVLGTDLPGAVTVRPLETGLPKDTGKKADSLNHEDEPLLRFSLAGVQLKFSAIMEDAGGLSIPAGGSGGSWIIKLPSTRFPSVPENEYAMMHLAKSVGINIPEIQLVSLKDIQGLPKDARSLRGKALAVKRFDRGDDNSKIHMEDFAQVFGIFPDAKYKEASYANIATVLQAETEEESVNEFIRRLAFTIMIGNADMHLKNWSLLYPNKGTPALSPAYDFVSTIPYLPDDGLALTFGKSRSLSRITKDQVRRFADKAGLAMSPTWTTVKETSEKIRESWTSLEEKVLLPNEIRQAIETQIRSVVISDEK